MARSSADTEGLGDDAAEEGLLALLLLRLRVVLLFPAVLAKGRFSGLKLTSLVTGGAGENGGWCSWGCAAGATERVGGKPPPKPGAAGLLCVFGDAMDGGRPLSGLVGAQPEKFNT
jgi:hypothetical protein